jgi:hypothetical protein
VHSLSQPADTVYKFRPNVWTLILAYQCLVMMLPALKFLHVPTVNEWSWAWVTLPIWAPIALLAVVLVVEQVVQLGKAKPSDQLHSLVGEPSVVNY